MIDNFALLEEPRRPWIDLEKLKQKFLALSGNAHPDRVHQAGEIEKRAAQRRYAELNAAYQCLSNPKERLLHLLQLECGTKPSSLQHIPEDLMNLSLEVGKLCQQADHLLATKAQQNSALLKVQIFEQAQKWIEQLTNLQHGLTARKEQCITEIKSIDAEWDSPAGSSSSRRRAALRRLEEIYRLLSYFVRWTGQIQERIVQLSL